MIDRTDSSDQLSDALGHVKELVPEQVPIGMILGSGLGEIADSLEEATTIETRTIPGYPASTVSGHKGELVVGRLAGRQVAVIRGRIHMYEGHDVGVVTFPIRLLDAMGVRHLIVTNAAGGINPDFVPGTLMLINDHINLAFANPLVGPNDGLGPRFPDMSEPYDESWMRRVEALALAEGIRLVRGVYLWTSGPSYETRAEIRAFARLGADAVGMSTVPEVIQAVHRGMKVLGVSTITNPAAGLSAEPLSHDEVIEVGKSVRGRLVRLVRAIVADLDT